MNGVLVIVPCGRSKIWDHNQHRGAVPAADAYTGAPFTVNRAYAEHFGDAWVILSAKYGFVAPMVLIPGPYEVTFRDRRTDPVSVGVLRHQVQEQHLDQFACVIGLGGKEYRTAITAAFAGTSVELAFPFAGLPIGKAMQAVNRARADARPGAIP